MKVYSPLATYECKLKVIEEFSPKDLEFRVNKFRSEMDSKMIVSTQTMTRKKPGKDFEEYVTVIDYLEEYTDEKKS